MKSPLPKKFNHRVAEQRRRLRDTLAEALADGRVTDPTTAQAQAQQSAS